VLTDRQELLITCSSYTLHVNDIYTYIYLFIHADHSGHAV
jgi:hypothetical protein